MLLINSYTNSQYLLLYAFFISNYDIKLLKTQKVFFNKIKIKDLCAFVIKYSIK